MTQPTPTSNVGAPAAAAPPVAAPAIWRGVAGRAAGSRGWRKAGIVAALLLIWQVAALAMDSPLILPTASDVLLELGRSFLRGELPGYAAQSLRVLVIGTLIGAALALVLTTLATMTPLGRDLLETLSAMFNPLPAIALLPVALLWFGLGERSLIFVIVHSVLWPMALNMYTGFITVPRTLTMVGQNFGLRGWGLVQGILLPAAFPHILTGLKLGWAFAWRTIIAAELVFGVAGSQGGLGWFINQKRYFLETSAVFAGLATVILIGLVVENLIFQQIEARTVRRWGMAAGGAGDAMRQP